MTHKQPLGQRVHAALISQGSHAAATLARDAGHPDLFARIHAVASEEPSPSFLHSALCAMSLPVRRPEDDQQAIIRQDGQYTLVITPKSIIQRSEGRQRLVVLGVPYGSLPRLILIHVMTEAVRTQSCHIVLGETFTDWMRRMGFRTVSYEPRGSATLIRQQLDRLLACEWMIRWEREEAGKQQEFGVREIKLTNEYAGTDRPGGTFMRELILTPAFFDHLRQHAVPLNEHVIRQLRDSATALDLYTWLAYRLPRLTGKRHASLSWQQLAVHFGNSGKNVRKFRQTIRDAWERQVSGVYPEARAEFDTSVIRLYPSPAPLQRRLVPGSNLELVGPVPQTETAPTTPASSPSSPERFMAALEMELGAVPFRTWLSDARLELGDDGAWQLTTTTRFKASWLRSQFDQALRRAAAATGLPKEPVVVVRPS